MRWSILMSIILLVTSVTWYNMVSLLFSFLFKLNLVLLLWLMQSLGDRYSRLKSHCVDDIIYSLYVYMYVEFDQYAIQLSVQQMPWLILFLCFILINYATLPPLTKLDTSISTMLNNKPNLFVGFEPKIRPYNLGIAPEVI